MQATIQVERIDRERDGRVLDSTELALALDEQNADYVVLEVERRRYLIKRQELRRLLTALLQQPG
jgi:hypothetical protein